MNARPGGGGKREDNEKSDGTPPDSPIRSQQQPPRETDVVTLPQETRDVKPIMAISGASPPRNRIPSTVQFVIPQRIFRYVVYSPGMKDEHYQLKEYINGREFGSAVPEVVDTDFDTQHPRKFRIKFGDPVQVLSRWVQRNKEFLGDWYLARYPGQQIREHRGKKDDVQQYIPLPSVDYGSLGLPFDTTRPDAADGPGVTTDGAGGAGPAAPVPPPAIAGPAAAVPPPAVTSKPPAVVAGPGVTTIGGAGGAGAAGPAAPVPKPQPQPAAAVPGVAADDDENSSDDEEYDNDELTKSQLEAWENEFLALEASAERAERKAKQKEEEEEKRKRKNQGREEAGPGKKRPRDGRDNNGAGPANPDGTGGNPKSIDFTRPGWNRF